MLLKSIFKATNYKYIKLHYNLILSLNHQFNLINIKKLITRASETLATYKQESGFDFERLLLLSLALAQFKVGEYKNCMKRINQLTIIRNPPDQPVEYAIRILQILTYFKTNSLDLLEKEVRSFSRHLDLQGVPDRGEKALFKTLLKYSPFDNKLFIREAQRCLKIPIPQHLYHPQIQAEIYIDWRNWLNNYTNKTGN